MEYTGNGMDAWSPCHREPDVDSFKCTYVLFNISGMVIQRPASCQSNARSAAVTKRGSKSRPGSSCHFEMLRLKKYDSEIRVSFSGFQWCVSFLRPKAWDVVGVTFSKTCCRYRSKYDGKRNIRETCERGTGRKLGRNRCHDAYFDKNTQDFQSFRELKADTAAWQMFFWKDGTGTGTQKCSCVMLYNVL